MWELDYKESWALKNWCFWSVVLGEDLESPLDCKEIKPVNAKGNQTWCWSWNSNTLAIWCKEVTHCKRPWCWKRFKAGGEEDDRGWDDWMPSLTWWTWVWASSEIGDGQGSLTCCNPWDHKELDPTEWVNWKPENHMLPAIQATAPYCIRSICISLDSKLQEVRDYILSILLKSD